MQPKLVYCPVDQLGNQAPIAQNGDGTYTVALSILNHKTVNNIWFTHPEPEKPLAESVKNGQCYGALGWDSMEKTLTETGISFTIKVEDICFNLEEVWLEEIDEEALGLPPHPTELQHLECDRRRLIMGKIRPTGPAAKVIQDKLDGDGVIHFSIRTRGNVQVRVIGGRNETFHRIITIEGFDLRKKNMTTELPLYQCHKKVRAGKITRVEYKADSEDGEGYYLHLEEPVLPVFVNGSWYGKNAPQSGGYLVIYADGYMSYSPSQPFENGYTLVAEPDDSKMEELLP